MSAALGEWALFLALAALVLGAAAGMIVTMSMYRAGLLLIVSFVAIAGLFVLLDAELLAIIQIMMNVAGMLAMIYFMVMLMMDPGGQMMWKMKREMSMPGPGALSMRMPGPVSDGDTAPEQTAHAHEMGSEAAAAGEQMGAMEMTDSADSTGSVHSMGSMASMGSPESSNSMEMSPAEHRQMMVDMAMSTEQLPLALWLGGAVGLGLVLLVLLTPWPTVPPRVAGDATAAVGTLLLTKYMLAFEGAALLILAGIAGAVILGRRESGAAAAAPSYATPAGVDDMREPHTTGAPEPDAQYICPMHPDVRSATPGVCPRCGMTLVPARQPGAPDSGGA